MMKPVSEITVNVDELLSVNKYEVDEETPHIELAEDDGSEAYNEEFLKLVRVCPAALYKVDGDGAKSFDYAGCLECGDCAERHLIVVGDNQLNHVAVGFAVLRQDGLHVVVGRPDVAGVEPPVGAAVHVGVVAGDGPDGAVVVEVVVVVVVVSSFGLTIVLVTE